jgi:16S rRNA G1207 methylase RsmC
MDHIWLVLQLTKAVKTSNFLLYARPPAPPCDLECFIKVSSIVFSTGHLFPGTKYLTTMMAPHFKKSVAPGWDIGAGGGSAGLFQVLYGILKISR